MRRLIVSSVTAVLLLAGSAAFAQTSITPAPAPPEPDGVSLTPFIGVGFGGDLESSPFTFGAALGYGLTSRWSVEGEVYFMPDLSEGQVVQFNASAWTVSADALYHFTASQFTPYIVGGIGFTNINADAESEGLGGDDTQTKFVWNWGAGVKSALSDRFGVRADLRYFTGDELVPDHWRLYGGVLIRRLGR